MIGQGMHGFVENKVLRVDDINDALMHATENRIFVISKAMQMGFSIEHIHEMTKIDCWFLQKLSQVVDIDSRLREFGAFSDLSQYCEIAEYSELIEYLEAPEFVELLRKAKTYGFSDFQIGRALGLEANMSMEEAGLLVRKWRKELDVVPTVSQIDTLAAEYPAQTNYLYLSYL
jgi:carbamoyl-phosphate synthase large subunit